MIKDGFEGVEAEIRREKSEALGRTGERLELTLRAIETIRRELLDLTSACESGNGALQASAEFKGKLMEHDLLCERARYLRHCLIIQREAMGLRRHDDVDRQYPMPASFALSRGILWGAGL